MPSPTNKNRVAITGIGPVSALGFGREAFTRALMESGSGVAELSQFDPDPLGFSTAAEIPPFDVEDYLLTPKTYLDHTTEIAFAGAFLAVKDAGLDPQELAGSKAGLICGTAMGSMQTADEFFAGFLEKGPRFVKPLLFPNAYLNTSASMLAIEYKLDGQHLNFASGFVAGAQALLAAFDFIRTGQCDLCLVGGFDALSEFLLAGCDMNDWAAVKTGDTPERSAPFDLARNGFTVGEAAAFVVLESVEHARKRNAVVRAELTGVAERNSLEPAGLKSAICRAMTAVAEGARPDLVLANADGSRMLDDIEGAAISKFAEGIPVTSIKPATGETFGASGLLQVCAGVGMLESGLIPGTLNTVDISPEYRFEILKQAQPQDKLNSIVTNTIDPGGSVVSAVLRRTPPD